jgi:Asp-tRNA(Asn)/Glu-tRNA(Gln) amidotransferase C subunit
MIEIPIVDSHSHVIDKGNVVRPGEGKEEEGQKEAMDNDESTREGMEMMGKWSMNQEE